MKTHLKYALGGGLALAFAAAPALANDKGWYLGGAVGIGEIQDIEVNFDPPNDSVELDGDSDAVEAVALGYDYANGWRSEVEISHRFNDTGSWYDPEFQEMVGTSDIRAWSAMINLYRDFNQGGTVQPYLGGGIGISQLQFNADGSVNGTDVSVDDNDEVFAAQAIAGLGWRLSQRWTADASYRYFYVPDASFSGASFEDAYVHHDLLVGLRYAFGQAAAPAAAPPAPPVAPVAAPVVADCDDVNFVVYFEWDRSDLTDQAMGVIRNAAAQAEECTMVRVLIEGHADRSGAASYNVGLSERRARVVREALIGAGVAASLISIEAKGETDNAVATPDGAREPLNRRSEVVIEIE